MKRERGFLLEMNAGGELVQDDLHKHTKEKYKVDSPFLWGPIPYLLMLVCVVIDVSFFRSLFLQISYDEPYMILLEVAGLAFAADIVAAYAGILAKKVRQGLSNDKMNLYLLLAVPIFALMINAVLRVTTMSLDSIDGSVHPENVALTMIAIATPVFTSIGNFAIGFEGYNPLAKKMCREEMALDEAKDKSRRLKAIQAECEDFDGERMQQMDQAHFLNAKKELLNDALQLYADVRVRLMEQLGDPSASNVLSKPQSEAILSRLKEELQELEKLCRVEAEKDTDATETSKMYADGIASIDEANENEEELINSIMKIA